MHQPFLSSFETHESLFIEIEVESIKIFLITYTVIAFLGFFKLNIYGIDWS